MGCPLFGVGSMIPRRSIPNPNNCAQEDETWSELPNEHLRGGDSTTSSRYPLFKSLCRTKVSRKEASRVKQLCASGVQRCCLVWMLVTVTFEPCQPSRLDTSIQEI